MKKIIAIQTAGLLFLLAGVIGAAAVYRGNGSESAVPIFVIALLILSAVLFILAEIYIFKQKKIMEFLIRKTAPVKGESNAYANEILRKRIELSTLQSQINPHFLYNTLDSIRGEALVNQQPEIAQMTERLSRFFRYCISSQENIVKLSEEVRHVQDYFFIQKYRFGDRINLEIHIEDEQLYEKYLPKITLQPIVENSVAHGLEGIKRRGVVTISVSSSEDFLYIRVADNGNGMSQEELEKLNHRLKNRQVEVGGSGSSKHTGIAIKNVNSRVKICFGEQYGLHYRSLAGHGTQVEIVLPLIDDFTRETYERRLREMET